MTQTRTVDQRVAVAREFVARVFNGHNADAARNFFTANAKWHGGELGTIDGIENIVGLLKGFIGGLPDIRAEEQDVIANNDLVALRQVVRGTQTGAVLGIRPTGRSVRWDAVDIYRVTDDGKISEQWAFEDMAAILGQLGAVKLPWVP